MGLRLINTIVIVDISQGVTYTGPYAEACPGVIYLVYQQVRVMNGRGGIAEVEHLPDQLVDLHANLVIEFLCFR